MSCLHHHEVDDFISSLCTDHGYSLKGMAKVCVAKGAICYFCAITAAQPCALCYLSFRHPSAFAALVSAEALAVSVPLLVFAHFLFASVYVWV